MTVTRENTEIRDQSHEMWAEGTSDTDPHASDIKTFLEEYGYEASNMDSWYDSLQGFWRWSCDIKKF